MKNFINQVSIQNFKSIKNLEFEAKRINVFIGEPNTGKTNILEALSLFSLPINQDFNILDSLIRFQKIYDIFYEQEIEKTIKVQLDDKSYSLDRKDGEFYLQYKTGKTEHEDIRIYEEGFAANEITFKSNVKSYNFQETDVSQTADKDFLLPPYGENLAEVILKNKELRRNLAAEIEGYNLELLVRKSENTIELLKREDGVGIAYSYSDISESLQKMIFYYSILESNKDSVIVMDNPMSGVFPAYEILFAKRITHTEDLQFFIATNSANILQILMEKTPNKELNIIVTYSEDNQTKLKIIPPKQIPNLMNFGTDILLNLEMLFEDE